MTDQERKVMQMVLDALEWHVSRTRPIEKTTEAIEALRQALAQPEQEPVAWMYPSDLKTFETNEATATAFSIKVGCPDEVSVPLYTAPPSKPWVSLTDEEIHNIYDELARREPYNVAVSRRNVARSIEAALRSKNEHHTQ